MFKKLMKNKNLGDIRKFISSDSGAITAEYAIIVVGAVGFAGLLVVVLRSGEVHKQLRDIIRGALSWRG
ncbi:DUF4244 domain-containing protein [Tropheryma whipplei]|uniref:DUF4244 domain-containing protein n=1 Tax=Tropheryma whipplei TaxID=2039 RepID=UPI0004B7C893|nr:DUF4244 domain-containing protein [Tropheryma whipplei]MCO8190330.1 DUF4244 domain-containing protein [Tropheryma whipplei]